MTTGGRILAFLLMLYAVGIFSYFIASISTVLVGLDAEQQQKEEPPERPREGEGSLRLSRGELDTLRCILEKAERP